MSMPKKTPQKPIILLYRPLSWLDEREAETLSWLMNNFPLQIASFENTVNILTFAIEQLEQPIVSFSYTIGDLENKAQEFDEAHVRQLVTVAALVQALDSLHAARRLLLSGYFSKMIAALRTMVEALRTADICKTDTNKAREWLQHKETKKSAKGSLHPIIKGMMREYDFLSKAGGHPLLYSSITSSIGKPYHEAFRKDDGVLKDAVSSLIEYLNKSAARFLKYVDESYPIDWSKDPELKRKKNLILGVQDPEFPSGNRTLEEQSMTLFKLNPETEADTEFMSRLADLFKEPPRMPVTMSIGQKNALAQFLERATVEMREMSHTGYAIGEAVRKVKGKRRRLSDTNKERGLIASAFVIGFEMGHDYALRWGKAF
jgi:hypothetical protein